MNDKPEIEIKIFGGTNMIAPAGATAVQNFYGDQFAEVAIRPEETEGIESLNDAECLLFTYLPDVKKVHEYTCLLYTSTGTDTHSSKHFKEWLGTRIDSRDRDMLWAHFPACRDGL